MLDELLGEPARVSTLGEALDLAVAERPDDRFALYEDDSFSVRDVDRMARRIGQSLARNGVSQGDRVAAFMYPSPWHLATILACARYGFIWCPINVSLAMEDLRYTLADLNPAMILVDDELLDNLRRVREQDSKLAGIDVAVHKGYSKSGNSFVDSWLADEELAGTAKCSPEDTLAIIYSGGTTGRPKGIEVSQFFALSCGFRLNQMASFSQGEIFFSTLQFAHAWTSLTVMPFCLYFGHVFAFWKWWSASSFMQYVRKFEASVVDPYVGMAATLLQTDESPTDKDHSVRLCIAGWGGDEPTAKSIRRRFEERFGIATLQMYALTEVGALACVEVEGEERRFGSSGKTRGWYTIRIADELGFPVPRGEIGEILVRPLVPNIIAKGYLNRAADTLFTWRDLWVHTGDYGRFDEDDYLYFVGRGDHFLRRRGELVSVGEVESTIAQMSGVEEVAVVAVPSELGEDDIKAFVRPAKGTGVVPSEVVEYTANRLAYFKVPLYVEIVESFPRSSTKQEIERFKLKQRPTGEPIPRPEKSHG